MSRPINPERYRAKRNGDIVRTIQVYNEAWERLEEMGKKEYRSRGGMATFVINDYYEKNYKKEENK